MRRKIVVLFGLLAGLAAGAGFLFDVLHWGPALVSAVEEQAQPPAPPSAEAQPAPPATSAPPAEQPDVTERGLPGQAMPPKPGMATPGGQRSLQKVPILPKLQASPPPPPQKAPAPPRSPAIAAKRTPSLSETLKVFGSLPGGAEVIANAMQRGAKIQSQALTGVNLANPGPWSVTLTPQRPRVGSPQNYRGSLNLHGLHLWGRLGNAYFLEGANPPQGSVGFAVTADFTVYVPRDGWYMVNCEVGVLNGGRATLRTYDRTYQGDYGYRPIYTFEVRSGGDSPRSLPSLVELSAGFHNFLLEISQDTQLEFIEASVTELER